MSLSTFLAACDADLQWLHEQRGRLWQVVGAVNFDDPPAPLRWGLHRPVKQWLRELVDAAVQLDAGEPPVLPADIGQLVNVTTAILLVRRLRNWATNAAGTPPVKSGGQPFPIPPPAASVAEPCVAEGGDRHAQALSSAYPFYR